MAVAVNVLSEVKGALVPGEWQSIHLAVGALVRGAILVGAGAGAGAGAALQTASLVEQIASPCQ